MTLSDLNKSISDKISEGFNKFIFSTGEMSPYSSFEMLDGFMLGVSEVDSQPLVRCRPLLMSNLHGEPYDYVKFVISDKLSLEQVENYDAFDMISALCGDDEVPLSVPKTIRSYSKAAIGIYPAEFSYYFGFLVGKPSAKLKSGEAIVRYEIIN